MNGYLVTFTNKAGTCIHAEYRLHHAISQLMAMNLAMLRFVEDTEGDMTDVDRKACDVHITPIIE